MRVLCFGDSNTYGYDPRGFFGGRYDAKDRWVDLLAKRTGWEILNLGVNGTEIPGSEASMQLLRQYAPVDLFLVMLGTNDLLQGLNACEAAAKMEAFLTFIRPCCKNRLLIAPPPLKRGAWVAVDTLVAESIQLADEYQLISKKLHIPFVDTRSWNIVLCFDGVHFTEEGHHTFAENLWECLS